VAETRYVDPIRYPSYASQPTRDVRAWLLLLVTVIVPGGSPAAVRSRRRWAKISLSITAISWILAMIAGVIVLIDRTFLFTIGTNPFILTFLTVWLPIIAINWVVCLFDSLRRIRLVTISRSAPANASSRPSVPSCSSSWAAGLGDDDAQLTART
jgi:hypothetical protein